jgi:uncharacterized protein YndB with AHSA1/START domain
MNADDAPGPVCHRIEVALSVAQAFELFVNGMARWWPFKGHSCAGDEAVDVVFEPRVGGVVTELTRDGQRHPWGEVLVWQPPHRLVMTWHPAQPAAQATRVDLRFEPSDGGCVLHLRHDGWEARGANAHDVRGGYVEGWRLVLQHWAAAAAKE